MNEIAGRMLFWNDWNIINISPFSENHVIIKIDY